MTMVRVVAILMALAVAACSNLVALQNQPLTAEDLAARRPPIGANPAEPVPLELPASGDDRSQAGNRQAAVPVQRGYRMSAVANNGRSDDILVLLAFSGGGKRSSAYSYGVLQGLRDTPLADGRRLLDEVDEISSVSGGTFTAAYYGLHRDGLFQTYERDFLKQDVEGALLLDTLVPWKWGWLFSPYYGTNDRAAELYDDMLGFNGATYGDLLARGKPMINIGATDLNFGTVFQFNQDSFDMLCSDLTDYPLSRAVAASNGFQVLFTPITLTNHSANCPQMAPIRNAVLAVEPRGRLRTRAFQRVIRAYVDGQSTRYVHLMDGGIADNLALRGLTNRIDFMLSVPKDTPLWQLFRYQIDRSGIWRTRHILVVLADGQAASDEGWSKQRVVTGIGQILNSVSGAQIDAYNVETLEFFVETILPRVARTLEEEACPDHGGTTCGPVSVAFAHLSLSQVEDPDLRDRLLAIPTALTLEDADVDAIAAAGRQLMLASADVREFLDRWQGATP